MPFSERHGDLFAATDMDALAHGVNCRGVMGAGIAKGFKARWPEMFAHYRTNCEARALFPGVCLSIPANRGSDAMWICNLATQDRPGPDAKLRYIAGAMAEMMEWAEDSGGGIRRIGMPRIGCGIGGLEWVEVRMIVELLA